MKRFLIILISVVILGYILFSIIFWNDSLKSSECARLEIVIKDSATYNFITDKDIEDFLKRKKLHPVGKLMSDINTLEIHDSILTNRLIKSAEVYSTQRNAVVIKVNQRVPFYRVISDTKGSFYVDNKREVMPVSNSFALYVPIATGDIDEEYAKNELFDFITFLQDNPYWEAWIDQIVVKSNKDVELIPRVGDFRIIFGKLENYNEKLSRFSLFIEKGLNVVGWNRYSEINLKFDNQVVCTRK